MEFFKSNKFKLVLKSAVSLALLYFIFKFIGINKFYNELLNANIFYILAATFFVVFQIFFKVARWKAIVNVFNKNISFRSSLIYTLISFAFGIITPGRLGEFIKAKYLVEGIKLGPLKSFMTVVIDKIFDGLALILVGLFGLYFFQEKFGISRYAIYAFFSYIIILALTFIYFNKILELIYYILPKKYKINFKKFSINRKFYIRSLLFSVCIWVISTIQAFFIIKALGILSLSFFMVMGLITLMAISSMIPISIGGVGVREVVAISFLLMTGVPAEKSTTFSLMYTFITFGIPAIIGAILYSKKSISANGKRLP
ncbi:flippase-like domain-containing protein [Candidatus Woesearchaeota archaeon]|nr:flippase-like domain-containing protein [Candidatus Woesearchaeota archaeon]